MGGAMLHTGSCLCQRVRFVVDGPLELFFLCHCSRCRKETGSAHGANLFSKSATLTWSSGEAFVKTYELPGTRFAKSFCAECGSALPNVRSAGGLLIPAGSLDTDIDVRPNGHIQMASRANWDDGFADVPRFDVYPS
jgi:hypothetical protein